VDLVNDPAKLAGVLNRFSDIGWWMRGSTPPEAPLVLERLGIDADRVKCV
jgi:hypothetical protein